MSEDWEYHADYPTVPIGGGNPYEQCAHCGRSVPEINGRLEGHAQGCEYRVVKEAARRRVPAGRHEQEWTLVFCTGDRQVEVVRSRGDAPEAAAQAAREGNPHLRGFRCVAAVAGAAYVLTAPSHAADGEDIFD